MKQNNSTELLDNEQWNGPPDPPKPQIQMLVPDFPDFPWEIAIVEPFFVLYILNGSEGFWGLHNAQKYQRTPMETAWTRLTLPNIINIPTNIYAAQKMNVFVFGMFG